MKITYTQCTTAALLVAVAVASVSAQDKTPGYNHKIPEKIMTPDTVETRLGTLKFVDGVPTTETTQKLYDNLDFLRGVETFLNFIPATSIEAQRVAMAEQGVAKSNQVVIYDQLMDADTLMLTGNTETV